MSCYKAFYNRDKPCVRCPTEEMKGGINHTMEVHTPVLRAGMNIRKGDEHYD